MVKGENAEGRQAYKTMGGHTPIVVICDAAAIAFCIQSRL